MMELFNELRQSGNVFDCLIVGRNMVNKNPDNLEMLNEYVDFLLWLCDSLESLNEKKNYVSQAEATMVFFEENTTLTKDVLKKLERIREGISERWDGIQKLESRVCNEAIEEINKRNQDALKRLYDLKERVQHSDSQEILDKALVDISEVDRTIKHDYLSEEQQEHYGLLEKESTRIISEKIRQFERKKNIEYNQKAVDSFDSAFKEFKSNEGVYKNQTKLFELVSSTLFAFDASRLFNETLVYYNHVYSYIFSKLGDDGKYALTRFSIECERKMG